MRRTCTLITLTTALLICLPNPVLAQAADVSPSPGPAGSEGVTALDDPSALCLFAFDLAAREDDPDLSGAVRACLSLEEWLMASAAYPDALRGVEPMQLVIDLCSDESLGVGQYTLCEDVQAFLLGREEVAGPVEPGPDAQAYLAVIEAHDSESLAIDAQRDAAGDDTARLGEAWAARAAHDEGFIAEITALALPREVQAYVEQLANRTRVLMNLERLLAGDPLDSDRATRWQAAAEAQAEARLEVERALGLAPPALTMEPAEGPTEATIPRYGIGDWATVRQDGAPMLRIKVVAVQQNDAFRVRRVRERPERGNVYLSALLRYESRTRLAEYDAYDWEVFVDGEPYGRRALVLGAPKPSLASGTLRRGRKAQGWVTFEVPRRGEVVLAYQGGHSSGDEDPRFGIVVRRQ